ncbi:MAG: flagellar export protein FliJ [Thiobacillaceae bacterium]|nr:flagellar export protein FliJ [Thiobacillaceae bacterium]MCX7672006.1 flagellar export protein FliJ [Thiobacillaceae bacterium]MDW8323271.1 flagellar export protein FliJ [Burkholderiales bacterium]
MPNRPPLYSLLEHARHRLEAAERNLSLLRRKEEEARQRLAELEGYRREYHDRLAGASVNGMPIQLMRDYHVFLARIGQAIQHQGELVQQAHARWQTAHRQWLAARRRLQALEALAQRHRLREQERAKRLEQRTTDEHAQRTMRQRTTQGEP